MPSCFKSQGEAETPVAKPPTPLGFSFPLFPCVRRKRRRRGERAATTPRRERRKPTAYKEPDLREAAVMNTYLAYTHPYTEPATTTPPPHREHHRGCHILSSPLVCFL
jgi:hypothetical protein